ncbi:MAG: DUF4837 family protein [Bacteroidaceae bacterium]|nr:DUF4837 family protein [Bacteroidaceae bacterium]
MKKIGLLIRPLLAVLLLVSCQGTKQPKRLAESKGMPCELTVVMDPAVMSSDLRDSVKTIVEGDAPDLPVGEDIFRVNNISSRGYSGIFTVMHSLVFFEIDPQLKAPRLGIARDVEAKPQLQVHCMAPSVEQMRSFMSEKREAIQRAVIDFQLDRIATLTQRQYSKKVFDDVSQVCGYELKMPVDIIATKRGQHFVWGGTNRGEKDLNCLFYTLPWDGTDQAFSVEHFVEQRDSVLRANIPGSQPGQYMTTSRNDADEPVVWPRLRRLQGQQTLEVHGLWELKGGYMGGPFVSLVRVDTANRQIVVSEGFVFNPNAPKRDLLRQLEGALRTAKPLRQR